VLICVKQIQLQSIYPSYLNFTWWHYTTIEWEYKSVCDTDITLTHTIISYYTVYFFKKLLRVSCVGVYEPVFHSDIQTCFVCWSIKYNFVCADMSMRSQANELGYEIKSTLSYDPNYVRQCLDCCPSNVSSNCTITCVCCKDDQDCIEFCGKFPPNYVPLCVSKKYCECIPFPPTIAIWEFEY
jgi:hypothetical protein